MTIVCRPWSATSLTEDSLNALLQLLSSLLRPLLMYFAIRHADKACAQVVRASDFGSNDRSYFVKTHLGQVLHPGDTALGYDLTTANLVDPELERCMNKGMTVPDVVLVGPCPTPSSRKLPCLHSHICCPFLLDMFWWCNASNTSVMCPSGSGHSLGSGCGRFGQNNRDTAELLEEQSTRLHHSRAEVTQMPCPPKEKGVFCLASGMCRPFIDRLDYDGALCPATFLWDTAMCPVKP